MSEDVPVKTTIEVIAHAKQGSDDSFDMMPMMMMVFGVMMMTVMIMVMDSVSGIEAYTQAITPQGVSEGYVLTATTCIQTLEFDTPLQSIVVRNDGDSTVYLMLNTSNGMPSVVRAWEAFSVDYDIHCIEKLFYYTTTGTALLRVTGLY